MTRFAAAALTAILISATHGVRAQIQSGSIGSPQHTATIDYSAELKRLQTLKDSERVSAAQFLYVRIGQDLTVAQRRISELAARRSGAIEAERKLSENLALDRAAVQSGRIRAGDTTIQTQTAREELMAALALKKQIESNLISSDPEINQLLSYRKLIGRELQ
jgi:hypothetical protein